ncbi:MAG: DUF5702 domain-containing protein [Faecalicatena sp.]|uniref:DUF5702 domain-containing protein n=1 Tax=Faecalicatena sp. TaxID=2005360 RepID=UPI00258A3A07|nr:DUF5702 domain-containing protein [Faecalicatena sp.]MCI6467387.1 DUF5702 domain-containing protein [Faecalicatena sp.]MDY5621017.1 DUF5702 domain-containing protein [Lachnospiraceae bacterium]
MKRGEVTAFLSLIFVLLISFITAMLESTMLQVSKNQKRLDVDRAIFSIFGEYQKNLLEEYEILAIDGSYGTKTYREDNLLDRMRYYGTLGIEHEMEGIQYLTDKNGSAFREQVLDYMERTYGISIVRDLAGMAGIWEEQEMQGEEVKRQDEEWNQELENVLEEGESMLPAENNPLPNVSNLKQSNILQLVLPGEFQISNKRISAGDQPGGRHLRSGRGSFYTRQGMNGLEERLLFHEYLLKKFGNAVEPKGENRSLSYELEYMIGEKESDMENLESVVKRLIGIRFGINYLYLQTDAAKQAEAETLALTLSTLAALPAVAEIVKQVLIAAWAFGESIMDLRALMSGKKAALIKNSENWQLSLSSLMTLGSQDDTQDGMDAEGGLTYTDYMRILLFLKDEKNLTMKALDRVEQNLRLEKENPSFCIDACVVRLRLQNKAVIREGLTYEFPVYFGYETI